MTRKIKLEPNTQKKKQAYYQAVQMYWLIYSPKADTFNDF